MYLLLAFTHLCVIMSIRSDFVGTDAHNYVNGFISDGKAAFTLGTSQPVFYIYSKLLYMLFPYRQAFLVATAVIICYGVACFIYRFSENVVFSTFLYVTLFFYFTSFNISRQYMATSLVLLAACLVKNDRRVLAIILAAAAVGVHNTALVFVPSLLITEKNVTLKKINLTAVVSICFAVAFNVLFWPLVRLFVRLFPRYGGYVTTSGFTSVTQEGQGRNIYLTLFYLFFVVCAVFIINRRRNLRFYTGQEMQITRVLFDEERYKKLAYVLLPVMVAVSLGLAAASNLAIGRFKEYYSIYIICLIPGVIEVFKREKIIIYPVLAIVTLSLCVWMLLKNYSWVMPYRFFWQT